MRGARDSAWEDGYRERRGRYEQLADEATFALRERLRARAIDTHSITSRVKTLDSLREKVERNAYEEPLEEVEDIVGIRVVSLFLSDLPRVREALHETFDVLEEDDKILGLDDAEFGYMSQHYVARIKSTDAGARYDALKEINFEVQSRTIVMDAWASVSHHLAYKGRSSVPADLRKDFNALSGLFYVADRQFEAFAGNAQQSREDAALKLSRQTDAPEGEINLESLQAYLEARYPDREHLRARQDISEFAEELAQIGYQDLRELDLVLARSEPAFLHYESVNPPRSESGPEEPGRFADLGAARLSLAIGDSQYAEAYYPTPSSFEPYRAELL